MENSSYDIYAAAALQSLIAKAPLFDAKGQYGVAKTQEEIREVMNELCRSAHWYATLMVQAKPEFTKYLNEIRD